MAHRPTRTKGSGGEQERGAIDQGSELEAPSQRGMPSQEAVVSTLESAIGRSALVTSSSSAGSPRRAARPGNRNTRDGRCRYRPSSSPGKSYKIGSS